MICYHPMAKYHCKKNCKNNIYEREYHNVIVTSASTNKCTINTYYCDKTIVCEVLHSGAFQWFVMYLCCSATRGLHLFTEFDMRPHWDCFPMASSSSLPILGGCFLCVLPTHPPFSCPILFDSLGAEWSSSPDCCVCADVTVPSHHNISILPEVPPLCLFFFIIELKCSSFHRQQCQESMRDTLSAHTHTCRRTVRHGPPGDLGEIGPRQYLDWVCLPPIVPALLVYPCVPSVHKACLVCLRVFSCMRGIAKCICVDQRGLWRALFAYLRVCRCAEVCKPLFACIYLCLVCLEL